MNPKASVFLILAASAFLAGCTGPNSFTRVDLTANLSQETVARYEREWQALPGSPGMAMLEKSNWWPLGLVAYHRDAMVMREEGPHGPVYSVMSGHGFGPLSVLYARTTHASFDASGKRMSWMRMQNLLLGHLAMTHESNSLLADDRRETMFSAHLMHHLFAYHRVDAHAYWSLLTVPNPIGVNTHSHSAP